MRFISRVLSIFLVYGVFGCAANVYLFYRAFGLSLKEERAFGGTGVSVFSFYFNVPNHFNRRKLE